MKGNRVVVTGMGAVTPLGLDVDSSWAGICDGRSGAAMIDQFDAAAAERFGLINRSVPASELAQATRDLARKIASRSAESIARGKSAFYRQVEMPLDKAFELANQVMRDNLTADGDAQEGIGAFLEKRDPEWG